MSSPTNLEPWNDPAVEARVVASVLGEVSAFEAAEVARLLEEIPELAAFARRIEAVHGLLTEDARPLAGDEWRLSPERREKVLAVLGDGAGAVPPKFHGLAWETKQMKRRRWRRNLLLIAASVALGVFVMTALFSTLGVNVDSAKYVPSAQINDIINEQEEKVRQARMNMHKAMQDYGIVDTSRFSHAMGGRGDEVDDGSPGLSDEDADILKNGEVTANKPSTGERDSGGLASAGGGRGDVDERDERYANLSMRGGPAPATVRKEPAANKPSDIPLASEPESPARSPTTLALADGKRSGQQAGEAKRAHVVLPSDPATGELESSTITGHGGVSAGGGAGGVGKALAREELVPLQTELPEELHAGTPKDLSHSLAAHETARERALADAKLAQEKLASSSLAMSGTRTTESKDGLKGMKPGKSGDQGGQASGGDNDHTITLADKSVVPTGDFEGFINTGAPIGGAVDEISKSSGIVAENGRHKTNAPEPPPPPAARPVPGEKSDDGKFAFASRNTGVEMTGKFAREREAAAADGPASGEESNLSLRGELAAATNADRGTASEAESMSRLIKGKAGDIDGDDKPGDATAKHRELAEASKSLTGPSARPTGEINKRLAGEDVAKHDEANGTLTLSGSANYTGPTTINGGSLVAGRVVDKEAALTVQRESVLNGIDQGWEVTGMPQQVEEKGARTATTFPVTPATPTAFESDAFGNLFPTEYEPPELPNSVGLSRHDEVAGRKSPVLGDIPVVGRLFQEKEKSLWADNSEGVEQGQQERLREAGAKMDAARREFENIDISRFSSMGGGRGDEVVDGTASLLMKGKVNTFDLTQRIETIRAQIGGLKDLEGDELIRKAPMLGIQDSTISKYYPQFNDLVLKEKQAEESGLGANHPQRRAIRNQREVVQKLLVNASRDVRESLKLKLQQAEKELDVARTTLETDESAFMRKNQKYVAYQQALAEYNEQKAIASKHVEVAQANTKELGFDWLLGDANAKANDGTDQDGESLAEAKKENMKAPIPVVKPPAKPARPAAPVTIEASDTRVDPVSTFSLNVSDVSFRLGARALLAEGKLPDPASVRTEDYVNAMDYGDPMPARGEAVAATIQQVAQPFVPGRNLVRIGLRTAESGRAGGQALSLTILLDQSGSMERPDRVEAVRKTMKDLAGLLHAGDVVTVVGFARTPHLLVDRLPGERAAELPKLVLQAEPEGGTNMEAAFDLAAQAAARQFKPAAGNRVVLITDGAANLGQIDPRILSARIEGMRRAHIAFDACGVGTSGIDDTMLETLARHGDGRYLVIDGDDDTSLAKELAGAFRPAARNVKVQVRFNPDRVGKFHLLGFEKHLLAERDFRDDSVDAAELAAAEQGNALYQVELLPGGSGEIGDVAVRFQDTASGKMVEKHWTIPYAANTPVLDKAAPPMQLAAMSGLLAESLKGSPLGNLVRLKDMQATGNSLRNAYRGDERVATLVQMLGKAGTLKSE